VNTDAVLSELKGIVEYQGWRYDEPVRLGTVEDIINGNVRIECNFSRIAPFADRD
jgi:hypothetical protein